MPTNIPTNGADFLVGTSGDDTISALAGNDNLRGGLGADVLNGGAGFDRADYRDSAVGIVIQYDSGTQNSATGSGVGATSDGDVLTSIEAIVGSSHDDFVDGNGGDQTFFKIGGSDTFYGNGGVDKIDYEIATDAQAGMGIVVSLQNFTAGFANFDATDVNQWTTNTSGYLNSQVGTPRDVLLNISDVDGTQNADWIVGANGVANTLDGHDGDDNLFGMTGNDTLYGGDGHDLLDGGWDDDWLRGENGADRLYGDFGDDRLLGGNGHDALDGGTGEDRLYGDAGDDILYAGDDQDNDYMTGGAGFDQFVFGDNIGKDRVLDFTDGEDILDFSQNSGINDFSDLVMSEVNGHVRINVSNGNIVYVYDTALADLDASDFAFI